MVQNSSGAGPAMALVGCHHKNSVMAEQARTCAVRHAAASAGCGTRGGPGRCPTLQVSLLRRGVRTVPEDGASAGQNAWAWQEAAGWPWGIRISLPRGQTGRRRWHSRVTMPKPAFYRWILSAWQKAIPVIPAGCSLTMAGFTLPIMFWMMRRVERTDPWNVLRMEDFML